MGDDQKSTNDETTIRMLVEDWAGAVRERDYASIVRNHAPDIVMFDVPPPFQSRGIEAYKRTWDLFFKWADDPVVFDIEEMSVTAGRDVAFVTASMRCAGTEPDGLRTQLGFRLTIGLRKIDSQWIVMHEHHSIPAPQ